MTGRATRTYLEMRDPARLRPAAPVAGLTLQIEVPCPPERYRALYHGVGAAYHWVDRAAWSDDDIRAHLAQPGVEVWTAHLEDRLAGYFELRTWPDGSVEVAYFGLLPGFIGRGVGGALLTETLRTAWQRQPTRVWLHTSSLDHPAALANYRARGLDVTHVETYDVEA
ncbi:MAG: GNAT family N-acetyltransferase [Vicinamibacterales bacterium]